MQVTSNEFQSLRQSPHFAGAFYDSSVSGTNRSGEVEMRRRVLSAGFGVSREQNARRYFHGHERRDPDVPGPGSYNSLKPLGYDSKKFSMSPKEKALKSEATPGPGTYEPRTELSSTGKYFYSRYQNSGACVFSPRSSLRFQPAKKREQHLGPGVYETKLAMNSTGIYFYSQYRTAQVSKFARTPRNPVRTSLSTPGPGSYELPATFQIKVNRHLLQ